MSEFHINGYFTHSEMWALFHALNVLGEQPTLTEEEREYIESARNKLINAVE